MPSKKVPRKGGTRKNADGTVSHVVDHDTTVPVPAPPPVDPESRRKTTGAANTIGSIAIVCPEGSAVPKFVTLINRLPVELRKELVLVGGLSVAARLQFVFRVTKDVDSVYFNDSDSDLAHVLADRFNKTLEGHHIDLGEGVHLDIIETGDYDPEQLPDNSVERLFVESHRWAYGTATLERIVAVDPQDRHRSCLHRNPGGVQRRAGCHETRHSRRRTAAATRREEGQ